VRGSSLYSCKVAVVLQTQTNICNTLYGVRIHIDSQSGLAAVERSRSAKTHSLERSKTSRSFRRNGCEKDKTKIGAADCLPLAMDCKGQFAACRGRARVNQTRTQTETSRDGC